MASVSQMLPPRPSESGHWYDLRTGQPVYEVRGANGLMRPATLRDARKLLLVPGVTSITKMKAAPQLERWKRKQVCLSARTLPGIERITDEDDLFAAVEQDANEQARKAAARGTVIHAAIQGSFEGRPVAAEDLPYVEPVRAWLLQRYGLDGWLAEQSFACPLGFGSKTDLLNRNIPCIVDFKGKDFDESATGKDLAYMEHAMQLAAYREALGLHRADCVNIFFSRSIPGLVRAREWDEGELQKGWRMFKHCLGLWQEEKDYFPKLAEAA